MIEWLGSARVNQRNSHPSSERHVIMSAHRALYEAVREQVPLWVTSRPLGGRITDVDFPAKTGHS